MQLYIMILNSLSESLLEDRVVCRQLHCNLRKKYFQFVKSTQSAHYTGEGCGLTLVWRL